MSAVVVGEERVSVVLHPGWDGGRRIWLAEVDGWFVYVRATGSEYDSAMIRQGEQVDLGLRSTLREVREAIARHALRVPSPADMVRVGDAEVRVSLIRVPSERSVGRSWHEGDVQDQVDPDKVWHVQVCGDDKRGYVVFMDTGPEADDESIRPMEFATLAECREFVAAVALGAEDPFYKEHAGL